ncbi:MAG: hypothetical protein K2M63_11515 [Muribaculaceae bacterium]|nr:hypothetical protein [Muribaculaceae bacterium]
MNKYILILIFTIFSITAFAKAPNLHVEKMFDGSYNANKSVSLHVSKTPEKYFRGCTVTNNKSLLNTVSQLFEKDLPRATRSQDITNMGSRFRSMVIINNGEEIYIGLSYDENNGCYLFISGSQEAFK